MRFKFLRSSDGGLNTWAYMVGSGLTVFVTPIIWHIWQQVIFWLVGILIIVQIDRNLVAREKRIWKERHPNAKSDQDR